MMGKHGQGIPNCVDSLFVAWRNDSVHTLVSPEATVVFLGLTLELQACLTFLYP